MKIILLIALAISALAAVSANYHQPKIQNLLYRPPPRPRPNPYKTYRVRRQLSGSVVSDPQGTPTLNLQAIHKFEKDEIPNLPGGAFARGARLDYNNKWEFNFFFLLHFK